MKKPLIKIYFITVKTNRNKIIKVCTSRRLPGKKSPSRIYLMSIRHKSELFSSEVKVELISKLKSKWLHIYGNDKVDIDWDDASKKIFKLSNKGSVKTSTNEMDNWTRAQYLNTVERDGKKKPRKKVKSDTASLSKKQALDEYRVAFYENSYERSRFGTYPWYL